MPTGRLFYARTRTWRNGLGASQRWTGGGTGTHAGTLWPVTVVPWEGNERRGRCFGANHHYTLSTAEAQSPCSANHNPLLFPSVLHQRTYSTTPPLYLCAPSMLISSSYCSHCLSFCRWTHPLFWFIVLLYLVSVRMQLAEGKGFNLFTLNV